MKMLETKTVNWDNNEVSVEFLMDHSEDNAYELCYFFTKNQLDIVELCFKNYETDQTKLVFRNSFFKGHKFGDWPEELNAVNLETKARNLVKICYENI